MRTWLFIFIAAAVNAVQGKYALPWSKRRGSEYYVTSTPEISQYMATLQNICTSTSIITLPAQTAEYPYYETISINASCSTVVTNAGSTTTKDCPYVTSTPCAYGDCYDTFTATSTVTESLPGETTTEAYNCSNETVSTYYSETVTTPLSTSTSTFQCTTNVTSSTTISDQITATDTRTLTVPSPTTATTIVLVPTMLTTIVTEDGTTRVVTTTNTETETQTSDIVVPTIVLSTVVRDGTTQIVTTTNTETETQTSDVVVPTTVLSTVVRDGTTQIVTITTTSRDIVYQPGTAIAQEHKTVTEIQTSDIIVPTTLLSTVTRDGATHVLTVTSTSHDVVVQSGTTIIQGPSTVTLSAIPSMKPPSTVLRTISGSTMIATVTEPGGDIVQGPTTVTISTTATPPPQHSSPSPMPPHSAPGPPTCYVSGPTATTDSAGCDGRNCGIIFGGNAIVHWAPPPMSKPPILTEVRFENAKRSLTCITTTCNTEVFDKYYYTSLTSCQSPPCPSNALNSGCTIMVGPYQLPGGQTTYVPLIGPSGWNINIGPTATARDIGRCGPVGSQCVSIATTSFSSIIYTGSVASSTVFNTALGVSLVEYLLPQLPIYFPPGNVLGDCTTATFVTPARTASPTLLHARQGAGSFNAASADHTWAQATGIGLQRIMVDGATTETEKVTVTQGALSLSSRTSSGLLSGASSSAPLVSSPPPPSDDTVPLVVESTHSTTPVPQPSSTAAAPILISSTPSASPASADVKSSTAPIVAPMETSSIPSANPAPIDIKTSTAPTVMRSTAPTESQSTVTITDLPASEATALSELESLRSGISTFTGDLGNFVCEVLGCTWMGATITGTATFPTNTTSTSETIPPFAGAAVKKRSPRGWLDYAPIVPVVAGVFV